MDAYSENERLLAEDAEARRAREQEAAERERKLLAMGLQKHSVPDRIGRSERLPYYPPDGWRIVEIRPHDESGKVRVVLEELDPGG